MSSKTTVRQTKDADQRRLKEIIDLSFPRFYRFFASHSVNSEEGTVLVAENDVALSGFAKLIEFNVGANKYGCILWIAVYPSFRHQGIALNLTNAGTDFFMKEGAKAAFASTQRRNKAALATLRKAGFVQMRFLSL